MLFNEKIDYLIKLGMKTNRSFEVDFRTQMKKLPILVKHKLKDADGFIFKDLTHELAFEIFSVADDEVTDFDLSLCKLNPISFKESDLSLHINLPNKERIKTLEI